MPPDLDRFVQAQASLFPQVVDELARGRKETHWMWFVFPQVAGLGLSDMSRRYAIQSVDEARAYLAHPVLGARLRECARLVLEARGKSAETIFGSIDARKIRSSMTLFHRAAPGEPLFTQVLEQFFAGEEDQETLTRLGGRAGDDAGRSG